MRNASAIKNRSKIASLDSLIHSPARLLIVSMLFKTKTLDFIQLMKLTEFTWGNLSTHLSKLEDGKYVSITKTFNDKRPYTMISLTDLGKQAYISWGKAIVGLVPDSVLNSHLQEGNQPVPGEPETSKYPPENPREEQLIDELLLHDYSRLDADMLPIPEFNKW